MEGKSINMLNRFISILFALLAVFALTACSSNEPSETTSTTYPFSRKITFVGGMKYIGSSEDCDNPEGTACFYYFQDEVTDVMYVCGNKTGEGGVSAMLNPKTGLPLTFDDYLQIASED